MSIENNSPNKDITSRLSSWYANKHSIDPNKKPTLKEPDLDFKANVPDELKKLVLQKYNQAARFGLFQGDTKTISSWESDKAKVEIDELSKVLVELENILDFNYDGEFSQLELSHLDPAMKNANTLIEVIDQLKNIKYCFLSELSKTNIYQELLNKHSIINTKTIFNEKNVSKNDIHEYKNAIKNIFNSIFGLTADNLKENFDKFKSTYKLSNSCKSIYDPEFLGAINMLLINKFETDASVEQTPNPKNTVKKEETPAIKNQATTVSSQKNTFKKEDIITLGMTNPSYSVNYNHAVSEAKKYGLPPSHMLALISQESHWDIHAKSAVAEGLTQISRTTQAEIKNKLFTMAKTELENSKLKGTELDKAYKKKHDKISSMSPFKPKESIIMGTYYFHDLFNYYKTNYRLISEETALSLATIAYNYGITRLNEKLPSAKNLNASTDRNINNFINKFCNYTGKDEAIQQAVDYLKGIQKYRQTYDQYYASFGSYKPVEQSLLAGLEKPEKPKEQLADNKKVVALQNSSGTKPKPVKLASE